MTERLRFILGGLLILALSPVAIMGQESDGSEGRTIHDGIYSDAQLKRGAEVFEVVCFQCHETYEFESPWLYDLWDGESVYDLFRWTKEKMPEDAPGILEDTEYVDVLAYILSLNGVSSGEAELPTNSKDLRSILIQKPAEGGGR